MISISWCIVFALISLVGGIIVGFEISDKSNKKRTDQTINHIKDFYHEDLKIILNTKEEDNNENQT